MATAAHSGWLAGSAELDITPPLGVTLTGYAARPGPADHLLDPLHVRALALSTPDGAPIVLTGADLLGIDAGMVAEIHRQVAPWLPAERLLLNHSHTHAGPTLAPLRGMGWRNPAYAELVVRWTVSAVREALRKLRPARLSYGEALTQIGVNRREHRNGLVVLGSNEGGAYDPTVGVLRVEDTAGAPLACWVTHAVHPVVMGAGNTGISAEWPGAACDTLRAALGCPAVFAQGCSGDINPRRLGGWQTARSVGRELAGAALAAWERAAPLRPAPPGAAWTEALLPLQVPSLAEAEQAVVEARERLEAAEREAALHPDDAALAFRLHVPRALLEWAEDSAAAREPRLPPVAMPVQALRVGALTVVATAAETFSEIGGRLRGLAATDHTVALGYSNGCFGYLPTRAAFAQGGYEVDGAHRYYSTLMITPECEELTVAAAERALAALPAAEC